MTPYRVKFNVALPVTFKKRGKWILACCPILDVCSQGSDEDEAKKNLAEALSLFFLSCFERGTLDLVLKESGFVPEKQDTETEQPLPADNYVNVPIPFKVTQGSKAPCHA